MNRRDLLKGALGGAVAAAVPWTAWDVAAGPDLTALAVVKTKTVRDWSTYVVTGMDHFGALVVERWEPAIDETIWWAPDSWREVVSISSPDEGRS